LRHDPEIGFRGFPALGIDLLRFLVGERSREDDVVSALPVGGRGRFVLRRQLQRVFGELRRTIREIDRDLSIVDLRTLDQVLDASAAQRRVPATVLSA
jgi:hypothetical protein